MKCFLRHFRLAVGVCAMLCLAAPALAFQPAQTPVGRAFAATGSIELAFTPGDDATALVVKTLAGAKKQVLVQAYSFTSREIAAALVAARRRGVDVRVIADREETEKIDRNRIAEIAAGGVPVFIDGAHAAAHNKVMVIDAGTPGAAVVTGSFNFTYAAQFHNAENLLVLRGNASLADAYAANWQRHRQHAWPYAKGGF